MKKIKYLLSFFPLFSPLLSEDLLNWQFHSGCPKNIQKTSLRWRKDVKKVILSQKDVIQ